MGPVLKEYLRPVLEAYEEQKEKKTLPAEAPEQYRNWCINVFLARMEVLPDQDPEYKECLFLVQALSNGWLVSDIESLSTLYNSVQTLPAALKPAGNKLLGQYLSAKLNTLADRYELTKLTNAYWVTLQREDRRYKAIASEEIAKNGSRVVFPAEYPQDKDFSKTAGKEDVEGGVIYKEMDQEALDAIQAAHARENTDYIFDEISEAKMQTDAAKAFVPNAGQKFNKIAKSTSKAICEVMGESVYDEIREMNRGEVRDRKVKLHHSLGTKYQKQGCDVLEMDFAGSGGRDILKPYKGRSGTIHYDLSPEEFLEVHGTQAKKPNGKPFDYIYYKDKTIELPDGSSSVKKRYAIAGPTPDFPILLGIPNLGEYSVENSREYARRFAEDFLTPRFESAWSPIPSAIRCGKTTS
ncbi:MAG: hypothetical protein K5772_04995 [Clostridia bacterium]|nr:hypothetical protein [Clostridia bacterium]